jgi:hypothetical protein
LALFSSSSEGSLGFPKPLPEGKVDPLQYYYFIIIILALTLHLSGEGDHAGTGLILAKIRAPLLSPYYVTIFVRGTRKMLDGANMV